jgi:hypothetical protein
MFTVTCQKNLGSVGIIIIFFITIGKTGNRRARFRNPIFQVSHHLFYDELHSFSTFYALNFDKKLAVE